MKNKKIIILIVCLFAAVVGIITANILIKSKEDKSVTENKVNTINKTSVLETADPAKAAELIKENIVKITNEVKGEKVTGTGFFHETGYLITNSHVVDLKGTITITYYDGTTANATLVANDMTSDIAILSVVEQKALALTFGSTLTLKVTDELYAIGYPFALEGEATTTKGILSARRSAGGIEYLQTDMSLNTGNSGGPLINAKAEVFGMTTYATENASLGMSISAESLESIIQKLITNKETKYLETDRESNALSTVLTEIGHKDEDIYDEKERLDKVFEREQPKEEKEEQKQETKPVVKKSGETRLSKLTVNGKSIKPEDIREHWQQFVIRRQEYEKLNIVAVPKDSKAKVTIKNNGPFKMGTAQFVNIIVTAENGNKYEYSLYVVVTKPTNSKATSFSVETSFEYDYERKAYGLSPIFYANDKYGNEASDEFADPYSKFSMTLYLKTTEGKRELKTYSYTDKQLNYIDGIYSGEKIFVKESELHKLLNDEDYTLTDNTEAEIEVKATLTTWSQGTYTSTNTFYIKK